MIALDEKMLDYLLSRKPQKEMMLSHEISMQKMIFFSIEIDPFTVFSSLDIGHVA